MQQSMAHKNNRIEPVQLEKGHRKLKHQAHLYFDQLWKLNHFDRNEAYGHMAEWFGVEEPEVHMTNATPEMCKEIIRRSCQLLNDMRRLDMDFGANPPTPHYEVREELTQYALSL